MSEEHLSNAGTADQPLFRRGNVDDAEALLRVIQAAFPNWPAFDIDVSPLEHLRWKMSLPASLRRDLHAVVELNGEVVACQVRWHSRIWVAGGEVPFEIGADMSVHPAAQGQGLARLIRTHERERMYHGRVIGFDTRPRHERMRALQAGDDYIRRPIPLWARAFDARTFLALHRANGGPVHLARSIAAAGVDRSRRRHPPPPRRDVRVDRVTEFDERASKLWRRVEPEFDLAMRRFADWLNWRYCDPRAGRIAVFAATEGDRLLGYAAFRLSGAGARVLDLVTDPEAGGVGCQLLERGALEARRAGCSHLMGLLPQGHRDEPELRAAGFRPTGAARAISVARARHAEFVPEFNEVLVDPSARLHITFGDFDHG